MKKTKHEYSFRCSPHKHTASKLGTDKTYSDEGKHVYKHEEVYEPGNDTVNNEESAKLH